MARQLNRSLLPERFIAETSIKLRGQWKTPKQGAAAPSAFQDPDTFEVRVLRDSGGSGLVVAAIELVSPANKANPANRSMFAFTSGDYLDNAVSLVIVDIVTEPSGSIRPELEGLGRRPLALPGVRPEDLSAIAYRTGRNAAGRLEVWPHVLNVGSPLPTLPLWLEPDLSLPLDLEETYRSACEARRIDM